MSDTDSKDVAEETCRKCRAWAVCEQGMEVGECRKRSASLYFRSGKPPGTAWPLTIADDWCCEFESAHVPNRFVLTPSQRDARITAAES